MTQTHAANNQPSTFAFFERFPTEESAQNYLINARWPNGVICPHCGHDKAYVINGGKLFRCKDKSCFKQFTVRIGTVMEDSKIPLQKWLYAMFIFGIHHKGVASTKMAEMIGVTQKTAWFMDHRLREAFADDGIVLDGEVEVDETFIGGKRRNMSNSKRKALKDTGRGAVGKMAVLGMTQRGGETIAFPISDTSAKNLSGNVNERVTEGSDVYTDEASGYNGVKARHSTVNHGDGEYVRGSVHTNTIEGIWSMLKRAHYGIYHYWSAQHLHRYVNEVTKRQNMKDLPAFDHSDGSGITMVRMIMAGMSGRRLTYKRLING